MRVTVGGRCTVAPSGVRHRSMSGRARRVTRGPPGIVRVQVQGRAVPSSVKRLVIVESPAKAKTISGYLGPGYVVEASYGHVRDLPRNAADVPPRFKGEAWARLGVDVDNGFYALYVQSSDRKAQIAKLKKLAKEVDEVYLATDEDREGEAIAWHLLETINPKVPVKRMVFHEITKPAIQAAIAN